jgi:hypothetical protein
LWFALTQLPFCFWRYKLFNSGIAIGKPLENDSEEKRKERQIFRLQAWKPHLYSIRKTNGDLRTGVEGIEFGSYETRGDAIHLKVGGRKTEVVFAPPKKNISGRGRKPKQNLNNLYPTSDTALLNQLLTGL